MTEVNLAAIYARVSSEDQGKGFSLPTQVEACLELAKREGYVVPENYIFQEEISGTILDGRPELRKVRELVNTKAVAVVIVHDPDWLARKLGYQILLDEEMERASSSSSPFTRGSVLPRGCSSSTCAEPLPSTSGQRSWSEHKEGSWRGPGRGIQMGGWCRLDTVTFPNPIRGGGRSTRERPPW